MSNYNNTKATIAANVYTNHANQVTAEMVKTAINAVVDTIIAGGFLYKGVAIPTTNPGSPDANVAYIAATAGTYTNFGGLVVADGEVAVLKYNGSWSKEVTGAATAAQVAALGQKVDDINIINGDTLFVTDSNGNIIAKIDAQGVHSVDFLIDNTPHNVVEGSALFITDQNNNIAVKIDKDGIHSILDKYAVAGLVLSDAFYPTATPTRNADGNVTHAAVMFSTGIAGELDLTYTDGLASSVDITYGAYSYTMTIARDSDGNATLVNIS